jgi:hypothetical protein
MGDRKMRVLRFLHGVLPLAAALSAAGDTLPLAAPPAPFAQKGGTVRTEIFKPEIKGSAIVSGNKKLEIRPDGQMRLYTDGRPTCRIYFYFRITNKSTGRQDWFSTGERKYFDTEKSALKADGSKFVYSGVIANAGVELGACRQTTELLSGGLIKIDADWSAGDSAEYELISSSMFFDFPAETAQDKKVIFNGREYFIPEKSKSKGYIFNTADGSGRPRDIEFFPEAPSQSFGVIAEKVQNACLNYNQYISGYSFRLFDDPKEKNLSFLLDIRKGVAGLEANLSGGIDFKALDDLDMPDYRSCKNLMPNPSFEQGLRDMRIMHHWVNWYYPGADKWTDIFSIDNTCARFGKSCLRIRTPCSGRKNWSDPGVTDSVPPNLGFSSVPLEPGAYTLSFYIRGDRPGRQTLLVNDKPFYPTAEWKRYEYNSNASGGRLKAEKNKQQPIVFEAMSETRDGNIWIDGMQLEKGEKATEFVTRAVESVLLSSAPGNFLRKGDCAGASLKIISKPEASGTVRVTVKNFFSEKLFEDSFKFKCGEDSLASVKLPFDEKFPRGVFVVKAEFALDSGEKTYDFHRFSIMDFLEGKHRLKNIFNYEYGDLSGMPNFPQILERWKYIGCGSAASVMSWRKDCFDLYSKHGIEVTDVSMGASYPPIKGVEGGALFVLKTPEPGNNKWTDFNDYRLNSSNAELTDEYLGRFKAAAAKIAGDAPWVKNWKWDSEFGLGSRYKLSFPDFIKLQGAFSKGVKTGSPDANVILDDGTNLAPESGIKSIDSELAAFAGTVRFDIVGGHPYRASPESPDLDTDTAELLKMLKKHGYDNAPVIFPEGMNYGPYNVPQWGIESARWSPPACWYWGALSYDMGWTEKIASAWRARSWLVALKYQDRVKVMSAGAANIFELDMNLTPFACQKIPNTLGRLLGDACFKKDIRFAPYTRCYIFEDAQKRPVAAVWGCHPKLDAGLTPPFEVSADFGGQTPEIFDLMEAERAASPDAAGSIKFPVSSFPLFFRGAPDSLPVIVKAFENARLLSAEGIAPVTVVSRVKSPGALDIIIRNMLSRKFIGQIEFAGEKLPVTVQPSSSSSFPVRLPAPLSAAGVTNEKISASVTDSSTGKTFPVDCSFEGFVCKKAAGAISVDGNPDDWKDIPAIPFKNRFDRKKDASVTDKDFSGWFKTAWTEKGFYLLVKITDDKFFARACENASDRWNNDSLQIYFDTLCDARQRETRGYGVSEYDYAVHPSPDGKSSEVFRRRSPDIQLTLGVYAPKDNTIADDIPSAFKLTADGYVYEVFFPAERLLPARMEKGVSVGFGLFVNDRDDDDGAKTALTVTPPGTGCYNNPHLWPVMLLWE